MPAIKKELQEGKGKRQILERKQLEILRHQGQLQTQRGEITKIRETINYNQCLCILDFGGHYSCRQRKIYQLVFVLLYRNDNGAEKFKYFNVWSDEKSKWCL